MNEAMTAITEQAMQRFADLLWVATRFGMNLGSS